MAGTIISGVIFGITAIIMLVIGIVQFRSKEPVGFYTGEKPPKKEQVSNVDNWNKKHGMIWIIYGVCIVLSWIGSAFIGNSLYAVVPLIVGVFIPIPVMILYHHILVKEYFIS